jgi:hypothetical protein
MMHENRSEPACKIVICEPMNKYRDILLDAFPGLITAEEFNETRQRIMVVACKQFVSPRGLAPAIFYLTTKRLQRKTISQRSLVKAIRSNDVTLRNYIRKFGHLFDIGIKTPRKTKLECINIPGLDGSMDGK